MTYSEMYDAPLLAKAILRYLMQEVSRVYWNVHQQEFEGDAEWEGLTARAYREYDDDDPRADLPNLECCGVAFSWYKHHGRGVRTNAGYSAAEWEVWLEQAYTRLADIDS